MQGRGSLAPPTRTHLLEFIAVRGGALQCVDGVPHKVRPLCGGGRETSKLVQLVGVKLVGVVKGLGPRFSQVSPLTTKR